MLQTNTVVIGEKRSSDLVSTMDSAEKWGSFLGVSSTGIQVNEHTALGLAAVYACVRVISEDIAVLPFGVYRKRNEIRKPYPEHPVHKLLNKKPNDRQTPFLFKEYMIAVCLLWGNSYARIIRNRLGDPIELKTYKPGECYPFEYQGKVYYSTPEGTVAQENIFHLAGLGFDGLAGKSPVRIQAENLGTPLNAQRFGRKFFENGAHLGSVLEHPGKLGDQAHKHLKDSWKFKHGGVDNVAETAILEEGMKYVRIGIPPDEAQFIETRQFSNEEIGGWFRVAPHLIGNNKNSTFSNIEHQSTDHVNNALMPWITRFEQEVDRKLIDESESDEVYCKCNANARLRGDIAARTQHYKEMWHIGLYSHNDILAMEDRNPVEGGDERYIQMQYVPLSKVGDMVDSQISKNKTPQPAPKQEGSNNTDNGKGNQSDRSE